MPRIPFEETKLPTQKELGKLARAAHKQAKRMTNKSKKACSVPPSNTLRCKTVTRHPG